MRSGQRSCLQNSTNLAAPGWPMLRWIFNNHARSSRANCWNFGPCWSATRSMTCRSLRGSSGSWSVWSRVTIGGGCVESSGVVDVSGINGDGSECASSVSTRAFLVRPESSRLGGGWSEIGASAEADPDSRGFGCAKITIPIRAAMCLRRNPLNVSFSHGSHSSSICTSSCLRRMHTIFRTGASPFGSLQFGPMWRSIPLQRTTWWTLWSGHSARTCCINGPESMTRVPTRFATWSASFIAVCQSMLGNRSWISVGPIFSVRRRLLVGCSSTSPANVSWDLRCWCKRILAICFANFLGYHSVNLLRSMVVPLTVVLPAMFWWSWSPLQYLPFRFLYNSSDVDCTTNRLRMSLPFCGSWRWPTLQRSKQHRKVCSGISWAPGTFNWLEPAGCSWW